MSEYQYYEFQAVDRPLTPEQMAELRTLSTRARITSTQLQNISHWGDFKGKPLVLMERYFDAFVYVANWGTHQFMVRLPRVLFDPRAAQGYDGKDSLIVHDKGDVVILEFISHDDEGGWIDDEEAESWMPALLPLRTELANGDVRGLYIAWLAGAAAGFLEDEETEPPVPPGLGTLSASLTALAAFLRVDDDLRSVAAAHSAELPDEPTPDEVADWIVQLPPAEKDALLLRLARAAPTAHAELRTAEERLETRSQQEAERQMAERARYLDSLVGTEETRGRQIDELIESKRPREYDQAVHILQDPSALADHVGEGEAFAARLASLRSRYAKRSSLIDRLDRADLLTS